MKNKQTTVNFFGNKIFSEVSVQFHFVKKYIKRFAEQKTMVQMFFIKFLFDQYFAETKNKNNLIPYFVVWIFGLTKEVTILNKCVIEEKELWVFPEKFYDYIS